MSRSLVVLESFPRPRPTTNPYVVMLARSLEAAGADVRYFSWPAALLSQYDVLHLHWPEALLAGRNPMKNLVRQLLYLFVLLRARRTRVLIVRTVHNLHLPSGISRRERLLLQLTERWTALRIRVNHSTELPAGLVFDTIVHGHYRDWFAEHTEPATVPGRLAFVGQIRNYKGVPKLVEAFGQTAGLPGADGLTLHVAGSPTSRDLADRLRAQAAPDPRIRLRLEFLSDAELVREVGEAELVVLAYAEMHNSGGALAALSLGRPVLVPANEVNRRLAEEVGPGWVLIYDGPLRADHLLAALAELRAEGGRAARQLSVPDLSAREWDRVGADHLAAFHRARNWRHSCGTVV
jgi:beta-1,4-mannosyltransferase